MYSITKGCDFMATSSFLEPVVLKRKKDIKRLGRILNMKENPLSDELFKKIDFKELTGDEATQFVEEYLKQLNLK